MSSQERKPVRGYHHYTVDPVAGRIYKGEKEVAQKFSEKDKVMYITLITPDGQHHRRRVAHLIYNTYRYAKGRRYVDYVDGNPRNCTLSNLTAALTKPMNRGTSNARSKLTVESVHRIRASKEPAEVVAAREGVSPATVWSVRTYRRWAHV